jgi:hypothetical protein
MTAGGTTFMVVPPFFSFVHHRQKKGAGSGVEISFEG